MARMLARERARDPISHPGRAGLSCVATAPYAAWVRLADFTNECLDDAMRPPTDASPGRVRIFRSAALEAFTYSHPVLAVLALAPVLSLCVRDSWPLSFGVVPPLALGALSWTFVEYLMHRFLFHARTSTQRAKAVMFVAHLHHHRYPRDPLRIAATPLQFGSITLFFMGLFRLALPAAWFAPALFGALAAYLAYEALHYLVHRTRVPWLAGLRRHHLAHHHREPNARWGISSPLWDIVFGTREET